MILTGILLGSLLTSPAVVAADESSLSVEFEVRTPEEGPVVDPSGETIQVPANEPLDFRLNVFEPGNRDVPVSGVDPASLIQIESADGAALPTLSHRWNEVLPGVYQATYLFEETGTFVVTILPDLVSRADLPEGSTDWVELEVGERAGLWVGVVAAAVLVLAVGLLIVVATRGRPRVAKEPVAHDTWWNSP